MKGKRIILLVLVMIFAIVGTACGGSNTSSGGSYEYNDYSTNDETEIDTSTADETENSYISTDISADETKTFLKTGLYTFYNVAEGLYLTYADRTLVLGETPVTWNVKETGVTGSYVFAGDVNLLLDIDNAYVHEGTTVKLWDKTSYMTQTWNVVENGDSTYSICSNADANYSLGFENGNAVLQITDSNNPAQQWIVTEAPKNYLSFTSDNAIIELQLPLDITTVISKTRIQQWANELETAYYTFYNLTGFVPYTKIIVEVYKPCEYTAYVLDDYNVIHVDNEFIYGDLAKMAVRESDWNFCVLHEMGHMFDTHRPWVFEPEVMTDLKVAYVLEVNGVAAAPSEFDETCSFYGADIINAYKVLGSDFSHTYNIYALAQRFLEIKNVIGWDPFIQTFHYMQENYDAYSGLSRQEMFENFIYLLTYHSGVEVSGYFSQDEWNTIINTCNK